MMSVEVDDLAFMQQQLTQELTCLAGKHVLITGGAGFIGYYLTLCLLEWNDKHSVESAIQITIIDKFMRGMPTWLSQRSNALTLIEHDISKPLPDLPDNIHYIFHAASIASPSFYRQYPIETMDATVTGFRHLLDFCVQQKTKYPISGLLLFSSSEIYGDPENTNIPTKENYLGRVSTTGPRACYDEAKRYAETLAVNFSQQYQLPIKIVRPFNNYGPGLSLNDKRVIADFANDILQNKDIVMYSNGSPTRSFCYIADAIVGYIKVLIHGKAGQAYNIGHPGPEVSMNQLAEFMIAIASQQFGYSGELRLAKSADQDYLTDNPQRRCPDVSKAFTDTAYQAHIDLTVGLEKTLAWYAQHEQF